MKIPALIVCAALAIALAASGQNESQKKMASTPPPQLSIQAQHFLNNLASEDESEIDLAKLALKKSGNPQIHQYAKSKILAADPAMERGAKAIEEGNHGPLVAYPTGTAKAEYYYLAKLSGKAFDQAYMSYEDQKQAADLIVVQNEAATAKNPQVKDFASKEEAPVREAAQAAQRIAQGLGG